MFKRKSKPKSITPIRTYQVTLPPESTSSILKHNLHFPKRTVLITRTLPSVPPATYTLTITNTSLPLITDCSFLLQNTTRTNITSAKIVATCHPSLAQNKTELLLRNESNDEAGTQKIEMNLTSSWIYKKYVIGLSLPPAWDDVSGQIREMSLLWKGTNDVESFGKKLDRGMNHKLVHPTTKTLLARYIREPSSGDIAGVIEIFANEHFDTSAVSAFLGPLDIEVGGNGNGVGVGAWDLLVIMSALVIAEKTWRFSLRMWGGGKVKVAAGAGAGAGAGAAVGVAAGVHLSNGVEENGENIAEVLEAIGGLGF